MKKSPRTPRCSISRAVPMNMLPSTIDDLLDFVDGGENETARPASVAKVVEGTAPQLILIASADGQVIFADECGSGLAREFIESLARRLPEYLCDREADTCLRETPLGISVLVAARLPNNAQQGIVACLVDFRAIPDGMPIYAAQSSIVGGVAAWAIAPP